MVGCKKVEPVLKLITHCHYLLSWMFMQRVWSRADNYDWNQEERPVTKFLVSILQKMTCIRRGRINERRDSMIGDNIALVLSRPKLTGCVCRWVKLNGLKLQMISDNLMPLIRPTRLQPGAVINLPPVTMAYLVFPYADVQLCRQWSTIMNSKWFYDEIVLSDSLEKIYGRKSHN